MEKLDSPKRLNYMDPNKVTESLKQLLIELQKVKDLNNMANEYKTISANLVLALQNYLNDNREFSNSFNEYLNHTNESVKETNNALEKAVGTINNAIQKMGLADSRINDEMNRLSEGLSQLKLQFLNIENLYKQCLTLGQQITDDFSSAINTATQKITANNDAVVKKTESCILNFTEQIKDSNNSIVEQLNSTYNKVNTIIEQNKNLVVQLSKEGHDVSQQLDEIGKYIARVEEKIDKGQEQVLMEYRAIRAQLESLHDDFTNSLTQTKNEFVKIENANHLDLKNNIMQLYKKTGISLTCSRVEIILLILIIILISTLIIR